MIVRKLQARSLDVLLRISYRPLLALLALLALLGLFSRAPLSNSVDQHFVRWVSGWGGLSVPAPQVLFIGFGPAQNELSSVTWQKLMDHLVALKPARILVDESVPGGFSMQHEAPLSLQPVCHALRTSRPGGGGTFRLAEKCPQNALIAVPPVMIGGYPWAFDLNLPAGLNQAKGLLSEAAKAQSADHSRMILNFSSAGARLPHIDYLRVEDTLIASMVEGRTLYLGAVPDPLEQGFSIPGQEGLQGYSAPELQAYALGNLLSRSYLREVPGYGSLLSVLLIVLLTLFSQQTRSLRVSLMLSTLMLSVLMALGWLAVVQLNLVLPVTAIVASHVATLLFVLYRRRIRDEIRIRGVIAELQDRLTPHQLPADFLSSANHWKKVAVMVNQHLDLKRTIFLRRIEGDHRVTEIESLNCGLDDILERRRDFERAPYRNAIEARGPFELRKTYLKNVVEGEIEFLVPLIFADKVLGFWALSVVPEPGWNRGAFLYNVNSFGLQIAELLFRKEQWDLEHSQQAGWFSQMLQSDLGQSLSEQLASTTALMHRRIAGLELSFDGLGTAAIVFDLFGTVLQANRRMQLIAEESGFGVYQLTALELLTRVTNVAEETGKAHLRHAVIKQIGVDLPAERLIEGQLHILHIRPLRNVEEAAVQRSDGLELRGLLFEFINVNQLARLYANKTELFNHMLNEFRNDLGALSIVHGLLEANAAGQASPPQRVLTILGEKISHMVHSIDVTETRLSRRNLPFTEDIITLNVVSIVNALISSYQRQAGQLRIQFRCQTPEYCHLAVADSKQLEKLLSHTIELMLGDAVSDSYIDIEVKDHIEGEDRKIHISLHNRGYGLPQDQLDNQVSAALSGQTELSDEAHLAQIGMLTEWCSHWGGEVRLRSAVGKGFRLEVTLPSLEI